MSNSVIVFDKPYSSDKIAEGRAIQWAVVSGACNKCDYLRRCENDVFFKFPQNAPCMIKKSKLLRSIHNGR